MHRNLLIMLIAQTASKCQAILAQGVRSLKMPKKTSSFQDFKELDTSSPNFMSQPFAEPKEGDSERPKDILENRVDGLYVCLISLHGLVRGERMELGKDPDTGGQVRP